MHLKIAAIVTKVSAYSNEPGILHEKKVILYDFIIKVIFIMKQRNEEQISAIRDPVRRALGEALLANHQSASFLPDTNWATGCTRLYIICNTKVHGMNSVVTHVKRRLQQP